MLVPAAVVVGVGDVTPCDIQNMTYFIHWHVLDADVDADAKTKINVRQCHE